MTHEISARRDSLSGATVPEDLVGHILAQRHRVTRCLRRGTDAGTLLAVDTSDDTPVVIQVVAQSRVPVGAQMRLEHEARRLSLIRSPWFQPPRDFGQDGHWLYVATPFVVGETLADRNRRGPRSVEETLAVASGLLAALIDIHRVGALHRAVNPSHLVFDASESSSRVKLTGFGLTTAGMASANAELADNVHYFSPEQAGLIDRDLGPATDLYATGVVLFECLAGHPPFQDAVISKLLHKQMTAPVPKLRSLGVETPRALDEMIHRLLRKDPRDRYQSAEAVLADVRSLRQSLRQGVVEPKIVVGGRDKRRTLTEPAFVGRERELELLDRQLKRAREGSGTLVFLESESGGGKTQLLSELAQRAAGQGFAVLRGHIANDGRMRPAEVLDGVLRQCVVWAQADAEYREQLTHRLGDHCARLAALRPDIAKQLGWLEADQPPSEPLGEMLTVSALSALVEALGTPERPALLLLDDGQWMDQLTLRFLVRWYAGLNHATAAGRHVAIVVAYRTEEVDDESLLRRIRPLAQLKLSVLDPQEVRRLAESMAGPLPEEAIDIVCRLSHGSPFMVSAVLRGLVESKALVREPEGWRVEPLAVADMQSSQVAAEFLSCRLDLLPQRVTELLTIGAILGKEFNLRAAADLAGHPPEEAIAALDEARSRHLLWVRPDGSMCVFVHDRIRAALLERISTSERRNLHYQAAIRLQQEQPNAHLDLAYHFDAAGKSDLALDDALKAAEEARQRHLLEVAEQQYRIAQRGSLQASSSVRFRIAEGLGDVTMMRGRYDEAASLFERAALLAEGQFAQAKSLGKLGELAFKRGDIEQGIKSLEGALRLLKRRVPKSRLAYFWGAVRESVVQELHSLFPTLFVGARRSAPSPEERLSWHLLSRLNHGYWFARSRSHILWAHLRGMNRSERFQPTLELAQIYAEHASAMSLVQRTDRGIRYARKSIEIRTQLDDAWGQGQSLSCYSVALYSSGQFKEALEKAREAVRLLQRTGDMVDVHLAQYQVALSLFRQGDLNSAVYEARALHQSGQDLGDPQAVAFSLSAWAQATGGGLPRELIGHELQRGRKDPQGLAHLLLAEGITLMHKDHPEAAAEVLERAITSATQAGISNAYIAPLYAWRLTALRQLLEQCPAYQPQQRQVTLWRARRAADESLRLAQQFPNDLPHIQRELAFLDALRGNSRGAKKWLERSRRAATQRGAQYEAALSLQAYGKLGANCGWADAGACREQAELKLRQLELPPEVQEGLGYAADESTLSLADRFENVLETGRRIASALSEESVFHEVHEAALRLLRGEKCLILRVTTASGSLELEPLAGDLDMRFRKSMVLEAIQMGRGFSFTEETSNQTSSDVFANELSVVCAPIFVRGNPKACVYVTQGQVSGFFGHDEERLAGFIATLAGAALENADGFQQLHRLNESLEQRVAERTAAAEARAQQLALSNQELERTAAELRLAQRELRSAKDAAEAASEAKSQFLAMVSHEIRTPMNGVIGMTELALATSLTKQQRGYLEVVRYSADSLLRLINDVLDFSKIEAGKLELELIDFSLPEIVSGALQVAAGSAAEKAIELIHSIQADVPEHLSGDPGRLRQIIVNLVGNAIKFTEQGEVYVQVEGLERTASHVTLKFSVSDTGIGIPQEKLDTIFESFQQVDSSTTRRFGGTGLGLSISSQLVRMMDGKIWVESELGAGSTFSFTARFATIPAAQQPEFDLRLRAARVLVVDQNPRRRKIHLRWLEAAGGVIHSVESQIDALAELTHADAAALPYDGVLVDGQSYGGEGWTLVNAIREDRQFDSLPIFLLVPAIRDADMEHCAMLPRVHCLTKPVARGLLIDAFQVLRPDLEFEEVPVASRSWSAPVATRPLEILLAEDGQINQMVATGLLELEGHRVDVVDNGQDAVNAWREKRYDVILMDLEMPIMDGMQAARQIREAEAGTAVRTPIIAMTAHAVSGFEERCRNAGMDEFITKPIQPERLFASLHQLAHGRPAGFELLPNHATRTE